MISSIVPMTEVGTAVELIVMQTSAHMLQQIRTGLWLGPFNYQMMPALSMCQPPMLWVT